jgi:multimeric flavodoxin WrbA
MYVLMINGSPKRKGNTGIALDEMIRVFDAEGVGTEVVTVGNQAIRGCTGCNRCAYIGKCVYDDLVNETVPKFEQADGLVIASPVYFGSANGTMISFLDRLFYSKHFDITMKVGASIAVTRRGGSSATYDELNKYFAMGMPIAQGQYWNGVHGNAPGEAVYDTEGMQQMRTLARNMVFLMRAIADAKERYGLPKKEPLTLTDFVRGDHY